MRLEVAQFVWGEGYCGPGTPEVIVNLVKPLNLSPKKTMLDLGAGLGGPARTIAKKYGVWITGLEPSPELAGIGMGQSVKAGMARRVSISPYDPETFAAFGQTFDCVFAKETFFRVDNKKRLFKVIEASLKVGGQVLVTDFVLGEPGSLEKEAIRQWIVREPVEPRPWAIDDLVTALEEASLDVRIAEDMTERYRRLITSGWVLSTDHLRPQVERLRDGGGSRQEFLNCLLDEFELWARRLALLEGGDLKVYYINAIKH